jgi:hypothetical protein
MVPHGPQNPCNDLRWLRLVDFRWCLTSRIIRATIFGGFVWLISDGGITDVISSKLRTQKNIPPSSIIGSSCRLVASFRAFPETAIGTIVQIRRSGALGEDGGTEISGTTPNLVLESSR